MVFTWSILCLNQFDLGLKIFDSSMIGLFQGLRIKVTNEDGIVIEGITYRKNLSH